MAESVPHFLADDAKFTAGAGRGAWSGGGALAAGGQVTTLGSSSNHRPSEGVMEIFVMAMLIATGAYTLKSRDERRRIALLGSHLGNYQIEKLMETLTEGYLRALAENDAARRQQIWQLLDSSELQLCEQFSRFAAAFSKVAEADARVSKLPVGLPFADKLFPAATFDMRQVLQIHAQGIAQAAQNSLGRTPKGKAFALSAELFLMQHSCHWFCKSKTVASARLLMRHQTSYEQVLASVAPDTRQAYGTLVGA